MTHVALTRTQAASELSLPFGSTSLWIVVGEGRTVTRGFVEQLRREGWLGLDKIPASSIIEEEAT